MDSYSPRYLFGVNKKPFSVNGVKSIAKTSNFSGIYVSLGEQLQKANPMNNSVIRLIIPKSNHHPTNKKPHECGA